MKIVQCMLRKMDGHETLLTWLDVQPKLKVGAVISLKDFKPNEKWNVMSIYEPSHDSKDFDFHRKWDNNNYDKHLGLHVNIKNRKADI